MEPGATAQTPTEPERQPGIAEDDEVDDLYKRSTGDPETDRLLREIRKEERSHSLAVQEIRSGGGAPNGGTSGAGAPPTSAPPEIPWAQPLSFKPI